MAFQLAFLEPFQQVVAEDWIKQILELLAPFLRPESIVRTSTPSNHFQNYFLIPSPLH